MDFFSLNLARSRPSVYPELTDCSHFEFGFNQTPFISRKSPTDDWFVRYGRARREPLPFREECVATAQRIRDNTRLPIHVMFSGGVDSEVTLRSFVLAGVPIEAAILRFSGDRNIHDISWAVITCEELRVPYRFYELDLLDFWERRLFEYADPTQCISPQLLSTMWLVDQIDGFPVMGSGECLLIKRDAPMPGEPDPEVYSSEPWELYEKEKIAAWYRHFMVRGRAGCPGFFQYTPEIMLAFLVDPYISKLCTNQFLHRYTTASSKLLHYQTHFPDIKSRPKYTGFERVQDLDAKYRKILVERYPNSGGIAKTSYAQLLDQLSP